MALFTAEVKKRMETAMRLALEVVKDAWYVNNDMRVYGPLSGDTLLKTAAMILPKVYDELKELESQNATEASPS